MMKQSTDKTFFPVYISSGLNFVPEIANGQMSRSADQKDVVSLLSCRAHTLVLLIQFVQAHYHGWM